MLIFAIESSCDETAVAIINEKHELLANVVSSQIDTHRLYGGVVPEIASRLHVENISVVIEEALRVSNIDLKENERCGCFCRDKRSRISRKFTCWLTSGKNIGFSLSQAINWCSSYCRTYLCQSMSG